MKKIYIMDEETLETILTDMGNILLEKLEEKGAIKVEDAPPAKEDQLIALTTLLMDEVISPINKRMRSLEEKIKHIKSRSV